MRVLFFFSLISISCVTGFTQNSVESNTVEGGVDSLLIKHLHIKNDTTKQKLDSLQFKVNSVADSVQALNAKIAKGPIKNFLISLAAKKKKAVTSDTTHQQLDSLHNKSRRGIESVKHTLNSDPTDKHTQKLDSAKDRITSKVDSLRVLKLPTEKYSKALDSLNQINPMDRLNKTEENLNEAQSKVEGVLSKPEEKIGEKLNVLSKEAGGEGNLPANVNLQGQNKSLPGNLPDTKLNTPSLPSVENPLEGGLKDIKSSSLPDLKEIENPFQEKMDEMIPKEKLNEIGSTTEVNDLSGKISGYTEDVKNISNGDINKVETIKEDLVKKVPLDGTEKLQEQLAIVDEKEAYIKSLRNMEEFKKQTLAKAKEMVITQFATQQAQQVKTVEKISSYQKRGESIFNSTKDLPKRPLKSKRPPLIERFVPGVTLQVQKTDSWLMDVNPTLRFRVRSIFSMGAGWNQRFVIDKSNYNEEKVYGLRTFSELSIRKGLSVRVDVERMNSVVHDQQQPDVSERGWIWSYMAGIKKDFSFVPGVIGNVQFMYNLYDPNKQSPYSTRLNVRFGFEFPLRKKGATSR